MHVLSLNGGQYEIPLERGETGAWSLMFSKGADEALGDIATTLNASRIDQRNTSSRLPIYNYTVAKTHTVL